MGKNGRPVHLPMMSFTAMMPLHKKRLPAFRAMRAPAAKAAEGRLSDGWQTPPLGQGCIMTKTSRPMEKPDGRFWMIGSVCVQRSLANNP